MVADIYDRPDGLLETQTIMKEQLREHFKAHAAYTSHNNLRVTNILVLVSIVAQLVVVLVGHHG